MKRINLGLLLLTIAGMVYAQAPSAFNYQAVLRNTDGTIKANEAVALQISLIDDNGSSSYMEIHNTRTNELGLINVVIGEGETSEDISTIDWSAKLYYLDITVNGLNLGSSQLLSVPYAMYSETANRALIDKVVDGDADPTNELQDLSLLAERTNVLELNNATEFAPDADYEPATKKYVDDKTKGHYIGEEYGGGTVFWVDESGGHGLIVGGILNITPPWSSKFVITDARRDGIEAGKINTERAYMANSGNNIFWQTQHQDNGGYGDWYVPSKYELNLLYTNRDAAGYASFSRPTWSSTEVDAEHAWYQIFSTGEQLEGVKDWVSMYCIIIRSF